MYVKEDSLSPKEMEVAIHAAFDYDHDTKIILLRVKEDFELYFE